MGLRRRLASTCESIVAVDTEYNYDDRILTYTGIMFEVFPRMDVDLLTMELDVRLPDDAANLTVSVYTLKGSYEQLGAYSRERWLEVTQTEAILLPDGQGAIVPTERFPTVSMKANERHSFFVAMQGPYLDNTAAGLQKTGDLQLARPEMDVFVGAGVEYTGFPNEFIRQRTFPQFAGVLHLQRPAVCQDVLTETAVSFEFLVDLPINGETLQNFDKYLDEALDQVLQESTTLRSYVEKFNLIRPRGVTNRRIEYDGFCPSDDDWSECPQYYVRTLAAFNHFEAISNERFQYEIYKVVDDIGALVQEKVGSPTALYLGYQSVSGQMKVSIKGVDAELDDVELEFLNKHLASFLRTETDATVVVFETDGAQQNLGNGVLTISGTILGAQTGYYALSNNFEERLFETMKNKQQEFFDVLLFNTLRPSQLTTDKNRIETFRAMTGIGINVTLDDIAQDTSSPSGSGGFKSPVEKNPSVVIPVCAAVVALAVIVYVATMFRRCHRNRHRSQDRENMKEFRKEREQRDRQSVLLQHHNKLREQAVAEQKKQEATTAPNSRDSSLSPNGKKPSTTASTKSPDRDEPVPPVTPEMQSKPKTESSAKATLPKDDANPVLRKSDTNPTPKAKSMLKTRAKSFDDSMLKPLTAPASKFAIGGYSGMTEPPKPSISRAKSMDDINSEIKPSRPGKKKSKKKKKKENDDETVGKDAKSAEKKAEKKAKKKAAKRAKSMEIKSRTDLLVGTDKEPTRGVSRSKSLDENEIGHVRKGKKPAKVENGDDAKPMVYYSARKPKKKSKQKQTDKTDEPAASESNPERTDSV